MEQIAGKTGRFVRMSALSVEKIGTVVVADLAVESAESRLDLERKVGWTGPIRCMLIAAVELGSSEAVFGREQIQLVAG